MGKVSDGEIRELSQGLRQRLRNEGYKEDLVAQAFCPGS